MKELELRDKEQTEIVKQAAVKKEARLIGSQLKVPGHTLFEYNTLTKTLEKATFKKQDLVLKYLDISTLHINSRVEFKSDCIYVQALNKKNALKRLKRDYNADTSLHQSEEQES